MLEGEGHTLLLTALLESIDQCEYSIREYLSGGGTDLRQMSHAGSASACVAVNEKSFVVETLP